MRNGLDRAEDDTHALQATRRGLQNVQNMFVRNPSRWPEQVIVEQQQLNETIEQELIPQQATEQLNN